MAPLPEPGPTPQLCPNCREPLAEPRPPFCPRCGISLRQRPLWLTVTSTVVAVFLAFAALGLGGFGACIALFAGMEGGGMLSSDALGVWAMIIGGVLCAVASVAILVWLVKSKPK